MRGSVHSLSQWGQNRADFDGTLGKLQKMRSRLKIAGPKERLTSRLIRDM